MTKTAVVIGVGAIQGLGAAICRQFAQGGHRVIVSGRTQEKIDRVVADIESRDGLAEAFAADVTQGDDIQKLIDHAATIGNVDAVIYNAGNNAIIPFDQLSAEQFEDFWRIGCMGGFLTAKAAVPLLLEQDRASLLFTGASGSLRGKASFAHFASAKAGLRMLTQSLAREYGPQGLHVGHVIVDGVINGDRIRKIVPEYLEKLGEDGSLKPDEIAKAFTMLHGQQPSAWTQELDLRPFSENW